MGHAETVQRLLEAGATVNYQNKVSATTPTSQPILVAIDLALHLFGKGDFTENPVL